MIAILKAIALVILAIAVLGIVILLFVTIWNEKFKIYVCEQCPDYPSFEGHERYLLHLKAEHPEKYEAAQEAGLTAWFERIGIGIGAILLGVAVLYIVSRRRD